jgi:regulator of RNase E activity RraA
VLDGVIRDVAETRQRDFPVFARGVIPIPGLKEVVLPLNEPVRCGGVEVSAGDIVVADEEGIVVVPRARRDETLRSAQAKVAKEAAESLDAWQEAHRTKIDEILRTNGFDG